MGEAFLRGSRAKVLLYVVNAEADAYLAEDSGEAFGSGAEGDELTGPRVASFWQLV